MPTGTQKFLAQGPVEFARTHPIVPDGSVNLGDAEEVVRHADESRHEIRPHRRLMTAQIVKQQNPTADKNLAYLLAARRHEPGTPIGADSFLTWFLPWNAGGGQVSMPIPDDEILGPGPDPTNVNPPYFFTVELTGCSVFIRGEPRRPEVFHNGGQNVTWEGSAGTHWRTLFARSRPQTFANERYVEVNKYHYIGGDVLGEKYTPPLVKRYVERVKEEEAARDPQFKLLDVAGFGCVFGWRNGAGEWSFYLQENVRVFYRRGAGGPIFTCANRALRVSQIYPTRAVISTNDAPKPLPIT